VGILADIQRAQEADRKRKERERASDKLVTAIVIRMAELELSKDERTLVVAKLAAALDESPASTVGSTVNAASVPPTTSAPTPTTFKERTLGLLRASATGLTTAEVADGVYRASDSQSLHKARSMLDYLVRRSEAYTKNGRWFAGASDPVKVSDSNASATPLVRRTITESARPLTSREIVTRVLSLNPNVPKSHIISAVHKMTARGEVAKVGECFALASSARQAPPEATVN
jgi:hypothetical protein